MDDIDSFSVEMAAFQDEFQEIATYCQKFFFMTRASEFQVEARDLLETFKPKALLLKQKAISLSYEDAANAMLCYEELIKAFVSELNMWISIKDDHSSLAWDYLVDAQTAIDIAMQAHELAGQMEDYVEHLSQLEQVLFPPQMFFSPGMIIRKARCSICHKEYGECDHLVGKPYMGQMCYREILEVDLQEVSLVETPANKRARGVFFTSQKEGIRRDILTWRVAVPSETDHELENGVYFSGEIDFAQKDK